MGRIRRRPVVRLFAALALAGFGWLLASTAGPFRSVTGRECNADEANDRLWHAHVPAAAADVWFTSGYRGTRVECTLDKEGFLAWCRGEGWRPSPIESAEPACVYSERDGMREIARGLQFSEMSGDHGYSGSYDEERERAYVTFSGG